MLMGMLMEICVQAPSPNSSCVFFFLLLDFISNKKQLLFFFCHLLCECRRKQTIIHPQQLIRKGYGYYLQCTKSFSCLIN